MKKMFRKFWVFENKDAVTLNHKEIEVFTRTFIQKVNNIQLVAKGAKIKIKNSPDFIIGNNCKIIKKINKIFLINFIKEIQKYTILNHYKINEKDIIHFYCCIIDLFAKPFFLKVLERQIRSERHLHGLTRGILKHLWCVSLFCYIKSKKEKYVLSITRAGFLHDITLKHNNFIADLTHQKSAASFAKRMGENDETISAIENHLFFDILRLKRYPKIKVARKLLLYDTIVSIHKRITSILLKIKSL